MPEKRCNISFNSEKKFIEENVVLDAKEVAKILGIGMNKMYLLMKAEGFPVIKIGRQYRVLMSELPEWLKMNIGTQVGV